MSTQTGFESSGGATFTTLPYEITFYGDVQAASTRMAWEIVGYSVQNRPIHLVTVGTGPVSILFYGLQHATEPAGRESHLAMMRDLALTTDPALVAYLSEWTVAFIPTINPDSFDDPTSLTGTANDRLNAYNVNINRDHVLTYNSPEGATVVGVLADLAPRILIDGHEQLTTTRESLQASHGRNLNTAPGIYTLGREMVHDIVRPAILAEGWTFGYYPSESQSQYGEPTTAGAAAYLSSAVGILMETKRTWDTASDRIAIHRIGCDAILEWHAGNSARIETAVAESRAFHVANDSPVYLDGSDAYPPSGPHPPTIILDPPPAGYFITEAQYATVGGRLDRFGITYAPATDGYFVPMSQEKRAVIAYMLDPQSNLKTVAAERLATPPVPAIDRRRGAMAAL